MQGMTSICKRWIPYRKIQSYQISPLIIAAHNRITIMSSMYPNANTIKRITLTTMTG